MEKQINFTAMSLDEIIFIDRNKEYGAYELRQSYNKNVKRAIMGMVFFSTSMVAYQNLLAAWHPQSPLKTIETVVNVSKIKTIEIKTPPPPPAEQKKEQIKAGKPNAATAAAPLEKRAVKDDRSTIDSIPIVDHTMDLAENTSPGVPGDIKGTEHGKDIIDLPKTEPTYNGEPMTVAEIMPEYPGGETALLSFIRDHLRYPQYESEVGIQGKAYVGFVIDERGKVTDVTIVKGVSKGIDRESVRVTKMLNDFTPGKQSGRNVKMRFVLPIDFKISAEQGF